MLHSMTKCALSYQIYILLEEANNEEDEQMKSICRSTHLIYEEITSLRVIRETQIKMKSFTTL